MRLLSRILARLGGQYYADPVAYWNRRHARHGGALDGVGCRGLGEEGNRADYLVKWEHLESVLRSACAPGAAVLDAGCGSGWFAGRAVGCGLLVDAVDFSAVAVGRARELVNGVRNWYVSDLAAFAPGHRYEAVMCIDLLFHVIDERHWQAIVHNLAALVQAGGSLVIQEHLVPRGAAGGAARSAQHVRWRSLEDYLRALQGWEMSSRDTYLLPAEKRHKDLLVFRRKTAA